MRISAERRRIFRIYQHVCVSCGAPYEDTSHNSTHCNPQCYRTEHNEYDIHVWGLFTAYCERYKLSRPQMFYMLTGRGVRAKTYERYKLHRDMSQETKAKITFILHKWVKDMDAGVYELHDPPVEIVTKTYIRRPKQGRYLKEIKRRPEPLAAFCPKRLHHCPGGHYPGDCPRNWRDCEFSVKKEQAKESWCKIEVRRGSIGELKSLVDGRKRVHSNGLATDRGVNRGEGESQRPGDVFPGGSGSHQ